MNVLQAHGAVLLRDVFDAGVLIFHVYWEAHIALVAMEVVFSLAHPTNAASVTVVGVSGQVVVEEFAFETVVSAKSCPTFDAIRPKFLLQVAI